MAALSPSGRPAGARRGIVAALLSGVVLTLAAGCQGSQSSQAPSPSTGFPASGHDPAPCSGQPQLTAGPPGPADWPVFDHQADRAGVDPSTAVATTRATARWDDHLDGAMFAQPLQVQGLVIEATEHDSVYALDAATGCRYWRTSLGTPFDVTTHHLQCNNITPELGVTATPAVDPISGTVYAVPFLDPGRYEMDAIDLASGRIRWRHRIDLPNSLVVQELSRPAVALADGHAYASFGGRIGDCANYHGFVVGIAQDGTGPQLLFQASASREGAIWAPGGPAVLPGGDLLVSTGNTGEQKVYDGSEAVVRLSPDLRRKDFFAPANWAQLNAEDLDLGSVSPAILDGGARLFQVGKEGVGYLLDANHLGGVGGQLFSAPIQGGCLAIGAVAYQAPLLYVPCQNGVVALRVSGSRFDFAWRGPGFAAGSPIVAGGLVWSFDYQGGVVYGLDPASGHPTTTIAVGPGEHFASASASAGRLVVPAGRELRSFALS